MEKQAILAQSALYQTADADLQLQMEERSQPTQLPAGAYYNMRHTVPGDRASGKSGTGVTLSSEIAQELDCGTTGR